ncbi:hypothetical protein NPIL_550351 [Nephila pilipes]|uniref:Uncharacterized protein n=1 Tax=Nephila pilipes TaxID=299642 RepID=A0A8X6NK93_NEPPI|nr:hypothetical protein NPIL_550351 [Nephila pilipes]
MYGMQEGKGPMKCSTLNKIIQNFEAAGSSCPRRVQSSASSSVALAIESSAFQVDGFCTRGMHSLEVSRHVVSYGKVWKSLRVALKYQLKLLHIHERKAGDRITCQYFEN